MEGRDMTDLTVAQVQAYTLRTYEWLHQHPHTRWNEDEVLEFIISELCPGPVTDGHGGIWTDFNVPGATKRLLFRADVDALPNGHTCGHDANASMLLGFYRLLREGLVVPKHNLRLVFQRAEENPGSDPRPESGGKVLVDNGVLEGVDEAYAIHLWATGEPGVFYSRPGQFLGNSDRLWITVHCSGGHVANPHKGVSAIWIANEIINALRGFPGRILGPSEQATLEPAHLIAGEPKATNFMPASATLAYGVRTMLVPQKRDEYMERIRAEVEAIVSRFPGASLEFKPVLGHPALTNDPNCYEQTRRLLEALGEKTEVHDPISGGEDFAHYLLKRPGCMWMLGVHQPGCGDHHSPTFNPDLNQLVRGVAFWCHLATS